VKQTFLRWNMQPDDLRNLTPAKARDLITRCLREAHRETFAQNEQMLGHNSAGPELDLIVEGAVRLAFREAHEDYENPSPAGLKRVVQVLARKSAAWGTPPEIIEHHKRQIAWVLECLASGVS